MTMGITGTIMLCFSMINLVMAHRPITEPLVLSGHVVFQQQPVKNLTLMFPGIGSTLTKTDGSFRIQLPSDYKAGTIQVTINDTLQILEPGNGLLIIPKNPDQLVVIRLGTFEEKEVFELVHTEIQRVLSATESRTELQTETILAKVEKIMKNNQVNYDSIRQIMLSEQEYKLLIEKEKNKYRASLVVPVMDSVYDFYISRAKDLRDAFARYGGNVFYNEQFAHALNESIKSYSEAYELLNARKSFITKNTELYYDPAVAQEVRTFVYDRTLQYFHIDKVLNSNVLMEDISDYNLRMKGRRKKTEIKNDINSFVADLSSGITYLSDNKERLSQKLSY